MKNIHCGNRIDFASQRNFRVFDRTYALLGGLYKVGVLPIFLILLFCSSSLTAQVNTSTIAGRITDTTGATITGAKVTATNTQNGAAATQVVGVDGSYSISGLLPGIYNVEVTSPNFATAVQRGQELLVGVTTTLNFTLQLASVAQTVEVTTAAPLVSTTTSDVSLVVETQQLDNLPTFSRSFTTLAQLSPGVLLNPAGTSVTVGNSSDNANNYIIDGVSVTNENGGGASTNLAQDWIQEFSVGEEQAPAEYGFATNGYINAVTRSGGNTIHGRAYGYFQNSALNAEPNFLPKSEAGAPPPYSLQRIGGFVGGPIRKDKLFYFLGYEGLHETQIQGVDLPPAFTQPYSTSGVFTVPTNQNLAIVKFDYTKSSTSSFHLKTNIYDAYNGYSGLTPTVAPSGTANDFASALEYQFTWDKVLSPSLVNQVLVHYLHYYQEIDDIQRLAQGPSYKGVSQFGVPAPNPSQETYAGDPYGYYASEVYTAANASVNDSSNGGKSDKYLTIADTLTLSKNAHTLIFGLEVGYRTFTDDQLDFNSDGAYTIADGMAPFNPATASLPNSSCTSCYPTALTLYPHAGGDASTNTAPDPYLAAYVQDSWRIKPVLTFNYGLRFDVDFSNIFFYPAPGLNEGTIDYSDLQPRFGFAWTPFHNDRTVIRGGAGLFYDQDYDGWVGVAGEITPQCAECNEGGLTGPTGIPETYVWSYNTSANPYCAVPASTGGVLCSPSVPTANENAFQEVLAYALATDTPPNFNPNNATGPGAKFTLQMPLGGPSYVVPAITQQIPPFQPNISVPFRTPGAAQLTIGFQRQFSTQIGTSLTVTSDFLYTNYFNQTLYYNSNINSSGSTINPTYGVVKDVSSQGYGNEYDFRNQVRYSDHRGDNIQAAYTLAYEDDNWPSIAGDTTFSAAYSHSPFATDPLDLTRDYGPGGGIPRNLLVVSGTAPIRYGLRLSPIMQFNNGLRSSPTTAAGPGAGPLVSSDCQVYYNDCYPAAPYNIKNQFVGANFFTLGSRLSERIPLREGKSLTLMFEGYNATNRLNVTTYNLNYTSNGITKNASFGAPTAGGPSRQLQAGFEFDF